MTPDKPTPRTLRPSVSVVIPAYNEEKTIVAVVEACLDVLAESCSDYEVIVVDDGSADATGRLIDELAGRLPRVRAIHNLHNQGTPETCFTLYRAARHEWICSLPADGQVTAAAIPKLLEGLNRFDVVVGERTRRRDPWYRLFCAWWWNLAVRMVLGLGVNDVDSVKLYPRRLIAAIAVVSRSALLEAEILFKARALGYRLGNVSVEHHPRQEGRATGVSMAITWLALRDLLRFRLGLPDLKHPTVRPARQSASAKWPLAVLIGLAALIFLGSVSARGLEADEVNYAAIAKHMIARGDWMTPYFFRSRDNGDLGLFVEPSTGMVPMWQKTPLGIWLIAGSFKLVGQSEFGARLPAAALSTATVGVTYALAMLLTGSAWAALLAGIVLLTSQPFLIVGQTYAYDSACILLMISAVYAYFVALRRDRRAMVLVGPLLGLAFFAKPWVPLLACPVFAGHLLVRRDFERLLGARLWLGILLGVAVNVPWFAYEYMRFGAPFATEFLSLTVGTGAGVLGPGYPDDFFYRNHALYYVRHLLVFYLPWVFLLPSAIRQGLCRHEDRDATTFGLMWGLIIFGAFTAAATRLPHYVAPIYPVLAVVLAMHLARLSEGERLGRGVAVALFVMAGLRIGYLVYAMRVQGASSPTIPWGIRWWLSLTLALMVTALLARGSLAFAKVRVAAVCAVLYLSHLAVTASYNVYVGRVDQKTVRDYIANAGPTTKVVGLAEEDLSRLSNSLYWDVGIIPFATDGPGLDRLVEPTPDRLFIIADEWGAGLIPTRVPGASMKLRFQAEQPLFLFEVNGRTKG